jgi:chaperonin GroES
MAVKKIKFQPLGARVLVEPVEEEKVTSSGIVLPDTVDKEKAQIGVVVALGTGSAKKDFKFHVKVGDKVYFKKYSPDEVKVEEAEYLVMDQDDILGIIG